MPSKKSPGKWNACKKVLANRPSAGLVMLIGELYKLSDDNRIFLETALLPKADDKLLAKVTRQFRRAFGYTASINNDFQWGSIRRQLLATMKGMNPDEQAILLLDLIDEACKTMGELGNYEEMVDATFALMKLLDDRLEALSTEGLAKVVERYQTLAKQWGRTFGYGLSDSIVGTAEEVAQYASNVAKHQQSSDPHDALMGRWHITEMSMFDAPDLHTLGQAFITLARDKACDMRFVCCSISLDIEYVLGVPEIAFNFHGDDDGHEVTGKGLFKLSDANTLSGSIRFQGGDHSTFVATRAM